MNHWRLAYWLVAALGLIAVWLGGWGPRPSQFHELLLHVAGSAVEMLLVTVSLANQRFPLAARLAALIAVSVATGFWARQATPSGAGVEVAHLIWLMLLVVILAGGLGWDLFTRVLERDRSTS